MIIHIPRDIDNSNPRDQICPHTSRDRHYLPVRTLILHEILLFQ